MQYAIFSSSRQTGNHFLSYSLLFLRKKRIPFNLRQLLLFPFLFFMLSQGQAQSYLGKTKDEILKRVVTDFPEASLHHTSDSTRAVIELINKYERIYYVLEGDKCIKFEVIKPYSCGCLEKDIQAYRENCISLGGLKWVSKDLLKVYEMTLGQESYSLTIVPNSKNLSGL